MDTRTGQLGGFDEVQRGAAQADQIDAAMKELRSTLPPKDFSGSLPRPEGQSRETAARLGYRQLSDLETAQVLAVRKLGEHAKAVLDSCEHADPRWKAIATTRLQEGLMALTRAVTKPEFF